jgi:N,N'-diacetyllegionaminate synthase
MQQSFLKKYTNGVFIIAEIGVNHNGNIDLAKKLIDVSKETKADAVKFQTFNTDKLVKKDAPKAEYQKENTKDDSSQYDMIKKLELSKKDFLELKKYAEEKDIMFMSTPFDLESVDILDEIGVEIFKVGSGDCDNFILLHKIIQTGKPIIISTGMANFEEIKKIKEFMDKNNYQHKYIFLHCLSSYPAPYDQMNMSCIKSLKEKLNIDVGFSDHTTDDTAAIMSVAFGAVCIEKHITLDNNMEGPDHKASLNPENFTRFVENVRNAEIMRGDSNKKCMPCEENVKQVARKNLVFAKYMKKGDIIGFNDIEALRPNIGGLSPMYYFDFIGKEIKNDVEKGDFVL